MAPKKKRANQGANATKMSTRSGRKSNSASEIIDSEQKIATETTQELPLDLEVKPVPRKPGRPKGSRKKKPIEVMPVLPIEQEPENETTSDSPETEISQPEMEEKTETDSEIVLKEESITTETVLQENDSTMETDDLITNPTDTCEISEQLENLNVAPQEDEFVPGIEEAKADESLEQTAQAENVEEQIVELDNFNELTVEYVAGEEYVVGETSEAENDEVANITEAQNEVEELMQDLTGYDAVKTDSPPEEQVTAAEEESKDASVAGTNVAEEEKIVLQNDLEAVLTNDEPSATEECSQNINNETSELNDTPALMDTSTEISSEIKAPKTIEEELEQMETNDDEDVPNKTSSNTSVDDIKEEIKSVESVAPVEEDKVVVSDKKSTAKSKQPRTKRASKKEPKEPKKPVPKKKPPKPKQPPKKESNYDKTEEVRRSSRIKSISVQKQRSKGHGLVKSLKPPDPEVTETSNSSSLDAEKPADSPNLPFALIEHDNKPVKVKSRWRRSSELEMNVLTPASVVMDTCGDGEKIAEFNDLADKAKVPEVNHDQEVAARLKQFVHLKENLYLTDRLTCKEAKKMTCDCFLTSEEIGRGEWGCGDDCLNRLLMIECGSLCPVSDRCTNKKFQKTQFAPVEVFKTDKKGLGLRAAANIPYGEFILEYVGEVLDHEEFDTRADDYSNDKNRHYYFMSLRADAIIDATMKGNISRFINHSCEPNAETQKWTVNGELRIGFFSTRTILAGEEITFDYRFQRYGKEAQKCYCEAPTCRGWLGEEPDDEDDEDEDEDEEEEPETDEQIKEELQEKTDQPIEKAVVQVVKPKKEPKPRKERKKRSPRKPRKDIFEDLDQLDDEIEMLVTTGLKNQAHTLKLSRLMVRAKEPAQRTKLLRILRRGELPCRRLFLDYHGLRLMHGYMTDAQYLAKSDKKFDSLRLEMLQTLATLPIPNKTMLQDSKVLPTVEKWSSPIKNIEVLVDSDSSPPPEQDPTQTPTQDERKIEDIPLPEPTVEDVKMEADAKVEESNEIRKSVGMDHDGVVENGSFTFTHGKELADEISDIFQEEPESSLPTTEALKEEIKQEVKAEEKSEEPNYEEEITALALKLLEEWSNLKEVFKIPKKERIEQMKEHEREANRGYITGIGLEQDTEKKSESRYRVLKRYRTIDKLDNSSARKSVKLDDRFSANFPKMSKFERRKMFALQVEQREEERRRKQREMWRQHEQHCILLGTDPRLTAPFDPSRGYQCIWNPQIGQWQNYPLQNPNMIFNPASSGVGSLQGLNLQAPNATFPPYLHSAGMIPSAVNPLHPLPPLPYQEEAKKDEDYSQTKFMGPIPPPVKLPAKWKCMKDKYGRPYYYHIKLRKSQWEPPPLSQPQEEPEYSSDTTSSSDTSSLSSDTSSEESDSDDDVDDSRLLMKVHKQVEKQSINKALAAKQEDESSNSPQVEEMKTDNDSFEQTNDEANEDIFSTVDARLKEIFKEDKAPSAAKKRRAGLVHEIIISPRSEEDRVQFREDLKRYKQNKEKLKKEKELILQQSKKHSKEKRPKTAIKLKMKEMSDANSETAKRIKESFRSSMATVVVSVLNAYRKPDCKEGRITNTEDFKHLARKLTHFVMLKEMKHIEKIEDLVCTENVKGKAKEYIRKYMSKFGENYQKRMDEPDF